MCGPRFSNCGASYGVYVATKVVPAVMNEDAVTESSVVRKPGVSPAKTRASLIDAWRSATRSAGVWFVLVADVASETAIDPSGVLLRSFVAPAWTRSKSLPPSVAP
jgi:hypothetical protein